MVGFYGSCSPTRGGGGRTQEGGALMSATHTPSLARYRDAVTELMEMGETFGDVEDAIDEVAELTQDQKAALWLFAFSLRDRKDQELDARAHLAAVD